MKKVVLWANSTWCIYNFRRSLIDRLLQEHCEVHVVAPLDPTYDNKTFIARFQELGVYFHSLPLAPRGKNPLRELFSLFETYKIFKALNPDFVLSYTVKCNLYAGFCRQILGFPQVANVPGLGEVFEKRSLLSTLVSSLYRVAFRGMTMACFQNKEDLQYCIERRLVPADRCKLLPGSGVNLSSFVPAYPAKNPEKRVFLMLGRLLPQKGYLDYAEAAKELKKVFGPKTECWVMGIEDKNRPESGKLLQELRAAQEAGDIKLLDPVVDVVPILSAVDVVVLPSRYNEGIPRSLLEALACGKAIITTDWRGCRETVENGRNGFLIPVNDTSALVQAMMHCAEMPASELRELGRQSRQIAEERFDEEAVLEAYMSTVLDRPYERARKITVSNFQIPSLQGVELPRTGTAQ